MSFVRKLVTSAALALGLSACTHSLLMIGSLEVRLPASGCKTFDRPQKIACFAPGGEPLFSLNAFALCQEHDPDMWRVVHTSGRQAIIIGGTCFTLEAQEANGETYHPDELMQEDPTPPIPRKNTM